MLRCQLPSCTCPLPFLCSSSGPGTSCSSAKSTSAGKERPPPASVGTCPLPAHHPDRPRRQKPTPTAQAKTGPPLGPKVTGAGHCVEVDCVFRRALICLGIGLASGLASEMLPGLAPPFGADLTSPPPGFCKLCEVLTFFMAL